MTIAALMAARSCEPMVATLHAKVLSGVRRPDGDILQVEDFSGSAEIWVPRQADVAATGVNAWFAFDVVVEPEPGERVDLPAQRLAVTNVSAAGDLSAGPLAAAFVDSVQSPTRPILATAQRKIG